MKTPANFDRATANATKRHAALAATTADTVPERIKRAAAMKAYSEAIQRLAWARYLA